MSRWGCNLLCFAAATTVPIPAPLIRRALIFVLLKIKFAIIEPFSDALGNRAVGESRAKCAVASIVPTLLTNEACIVGVCTVVALSIRRFKFPGGARQASTEYSRAGGAVKTAESFLFSRDFTEGRGKHTCSSGRALDAERFQCFLRRWIWKS